MIEVHDHIQCMFIIFTGQYMFIIFTGPYMFIIFTGAYMFKILTGPCTYDGEQYPDGSDWEVLPCTKCVCVDGQHSCYPVDCPPIVCAEVSTKCACKHSIPSVLLIVNLSSEHAFCPFDCQLTI